VSTRHAQFEKVLNGLVHKTLGDNMYAEIDTLDDGHTWRVGIGPPVVLRYGCFVLKPDAEFRGGNFAKAYTDAVNWVWQQKYDSLDVAYDQLQFKYDNVMSTMNVDYEDMFPDDNSLGADQDEGSRDA
jgi:hypothetical protein